MRPAVIALLLLAAAAPAEQPDPYLWLEQVDSPRALAWVRAENERTLKPLLTNPHYQPFLDQALALAQADDRIPTPEFLGGQVYNLWQDAAHVQGIWRRTTVDDYRAASPHWQTVIDVDALGRAEHHVWVWKADTCDHPADMRCLVSLSEGGEDAVTTREFDLASGAFVPGGFLLPHAKQVADWESADSILVGTDWGPGSMTESGYPFIIKRLHRGQKLAQATEVFRGTKQDVAVQVSTFADGQGHRAVVLQRGLDFFHDAFELVSAAGVVKLALPEKAEIEGLVHNQLVVKLNEDMASLRAGSLVALDMAHPDAAPALVWAPGARQSIDEVGVTAKRHRGVRAG